MSFHLDSSLFFVIKCCMVRAPVNILKLFFRYQYHHLIFFCPWVRFLICNGNVSSECRYLCITASFEGSKAKKSIFVVTTLANPLAAFAHLVFIQNLVLGHLHK